MLKSQTFKHWDIFKIYFNVFVYGYICVLVCEYVHLRGVLGSQKKVSGASDEPILK